MLSPNAKTIYYNFITDIKTHNSKAYIKVFGKKYTTTEIVTLLSSANAFSYNMPFESMKKMIKDCLHEIQTETENGITAVYDDDADKITITASNEYYEAVINKLV